MMKPTPRLAARQILAAALLAGVAACTAPRPAPTPPAPTPRPAPAPTSPMPTPPPTNWVDAPATPGDWYLRPDGANSRALFGQVGQEATFSLTCYRARGQITLARGGGAAQPVAMRILTETATRTLSAQPQAGPPPSLVATLAARDPLLDAMAFSKGRFAVETAGQPTLYIPSWPEVTRVIEDCR